MDKSTVVGMFAAIVLIIGSILIAPGSSLGAFIDYPSLATVVGGGIAATMIAFPLKTFLLAPKVTLKGVLPNPPSMAPAIKTIVECAEVARREGVLALERKVADIEDPFILMGIQMAVDGSDSELIESVMRTEMQAMASRHKTGKSLLETLGRYAPAFGMIGTLVGLVIMLGNMDDPAAIGPGMAVALLTTLYGALMSNCFALPLADKLNFYSKQEMEIREVIVQGILSIQNGDNPRVVEQKLSTFLSKGEREAMQKAA
ncbi:motility protein A [bacterium]|nr:motility protein A [bacterium]